MAVSIKYAGVHLCEMDGLLAVAVSSETADEEVCDNHHDVLPRLLYWEVVRFLATPPRPVGLSRVGEARLKFHNL